MTLKKSHLLVLLASFLYSVYLSINKIYLNTGLSPLQFACGSSLAGGFFSLIYLTFSKNRANLKKLTKKVG